MYGRIRNHFKDSRPADFRTRGCFVPFTAPDLFGARLREDGRGGFEVILPAGGQRGQAEVPLGNLHQVGTPTLFDRWLADHIAEAKPLDPLTLQGVIRRGLAEGLAGAEAAAAALVFAREKEEREAAIAALLPDLRPRAEPSSAGRPAAAPALGDGAAAGGAESPVPYLAALDWSPAHGFAGVGAWEARLRDFERKMYQRAEGAWQGSRLGAAFLAYLAALVSDALRMARSDLDPFAAPAALSAAWSRRPTELRALLLTPLWLFDGWDFILFLWDSAEDEAAQSRVVAEAVTYVPPIPVSVRARIEWPEALDKILEQAEASPSGGPLARSAFIREVQRNEARLARYYDVITRKEAA